LAHPYVIQLPAAARSVRLNNSPLRKGTNSFIGVE